MVQSLFWVHALPAVTAAQVVLFMQKLLVQSPPAEHGLPTLFFWHVPPEQLFVVQSLLAVHGEPAVTAAHALVPPTSQNLLQHWPPCVQAVPTGEHGTVVEVVALTHTLELASDDAEGQPGPHAWPAAQHVRLAPLPQGVVPAGHPHWL